MFEIEKMNLTLLNGTVIDGLKYGVGAIPCLIVGPASFYLNMLDTLKEIFTFYAFDGLWTHQKDEPINTEAIKAITLDGLAHEVEDIVKALKEQFGYCKIGLMGFSAPGLIAIQAAAQIGSSDIAFVIGSGIAATPLDPEFKATDIYFRRCASPTRINFFKRDEEEFKEFTKRPASPASKWRATIRSMAAKQVYDYKDSSVVERLCEIWGASPDGKILCEPMRVHFFNLLQEVTPSSLISSLLTHADIPFMLVYGEHDFTTPPPEESDVIAWMSQGLVYIKYPNSVHYPSFEAGSRHYFAQDVLGFVKKYEIQGVDALAIASKRACPL